MQKYLVRELFDQSVNHAYAMASVAAAEAPSDAPLVYKLEAPLIGPIGARARGPGGDMELKSGPNGPPLNATVFCALSKRLFIIDSACILVMRVVMNESGDAAPMSIVDEGILGDPGARLHLNNIIIGNATQLLACDSNGDIWEWCTTDLNRPLRRISNRTDSESAEGVKGGWDPSMDSTWGLAVAAGATPGSAGDGRVFAGSNAHCVTALHGSAVSMRMSGFIPIAHPVEDGDVGNSSIATDVRIVLKNPISNRYEPRHAHDSCGHHNSRLDRRLLTRTRANVPGVAATEWRDASGNVRTLVASGTLAGTLVISEVMASAKSVVATGKRIPERGGLCPPPAAKRLADRNLSLSDYADCFLDQELDIGGDDDDEQMVRTYCLVV